ncbi:hypothetical protein BHE74_00053077 [Ensete ventricosum]|nr:hypothetical protein BHE74_00053077 [Ensete ventricosum]
MGAGAVVPRNPHLVASLLRHLHASTRSSDLCDPGGTSRTPLLPMLPSPTSSLPSDYDNPNSFKHLSWPCGSLYSSLLPLYLSPTYSNLWLTSPVVAPPPLQLLRSTTAPPPVTAIH